MTWYCCHTRPRMEDVADIHLKRQGYTTFFPFTRVKRYVGRHTNGRRLLRIVDQPLFSRYIFVELSKPTQSLFAVNETYGVSVVVHIAGEPLEIPEGVIDELMERTDEQGMVIEEKPAHWFKNKPGDRVEINNRENPFHGLIAVISSVETLEKRDAIRVWLDFLGAKREVEVEVGSVKEIVQRSSRESGRAA